MSADNGHLDPQQGAAGASTSGTEGRADSTSPVTGTDLAPADIRFMDLNDKILDRIATQAALSVPGVVENSTGLNMLPGMKLPRFEFDRAPADGALYVRAHIAVRWPSPVAAVAQVARETIAEWLEHYTGSRVLAINVDVDDVIQPETDEEQGAFAAQRVTLAELDATPRTPELHRISAVTLATRAPEIHRHLAEDDIHRPQPLADLDVRSIEVPEAPEVRSIEVPDAPEVRSIAVPAEPSVRSISAPEPAALREVHARELEATPVSAPTPVEPMRIYTPAEPVVNRIPTPEPRKVTHPKAPAAPKVYVPKPISDVGLVRIPTQTGLAITKDIATPEGLPQRAIPTPEGLDVTIFPVSRRTELTPVDVHQHPVIVPEAPAENSQPRSVSVRPSQLRAELERELGLVEDDTDEQAEGSRALRADRPEHSEAKDADKVVATLVEQADVAPSTAHDGAEAGRTRSSEDASTDRAATAVKAEKPSDDDDADHRDAAREFRVVADKSAADAPAASGTPVVLKITVEGVDAVVVHNAETGSSQTLAVERTAQPEGDR